MAGSSDGDEAQSVVQGHVASDLLVADIPGSPRLKNISAQIGDPFLSMDEGHNGVSISAVNNDFQLIFN